MNLFKQFRDVVVGELEEMAAAATLPPALDLTRVAVEPPRDRTHGDLSTNAAMVLAKPAGQKPRDLAAALAARLEKHPQVTGVEVAGPGFINLRLAPAVWYARLGDILAAVTAYGASDLGQGRSEEHTSELQSLMRISYAVFCLT